MRRNASALTVLQKLCGLVPNWWQLRRTRFWTACCRGYAHKYQVRHAIDAQSLDGGSTAVLASFLRAEIATRPRHWRAKRRDQNGKHFSQTAPYGENLNFTFKGQRRPNCNMSETDVALCRVSVRSAGGDRRSGC